MGRCVRLQREYVHYNIAGQLANWYWSYTSGSPRTGISLLWQE